VSRSRGHTRTMMRWLMNRKPARRRGHLRWGRKERHALARLAADDSRLMDPRKRPGAVVRTVRTVLRQYRCTVADERARRSWTLRPFKSGTARRSRTCVARGFRCGGSRRRRRLRRRRLSEGS
jgi:hypothetical protein